MRLGDFMRRLSPGSSEPLDLPRLRRTIFETILIIGVVTTGNVAVGTQQDFIRPDQLAWLRPVLIVWVLLHPLLWLVSRRASLAIASAAHIVGATFILSCVIRSVPFDPLTVAVVQFAFQGALVVEGMLLLPAGWFLVVAGLTSVAVAAQCALASARPEPLALLTATLPLGALFVMCAVASRLLDRFHARSLEYQNHLAGEAGRLEAEVQRRTEVIEKQRAQILQMQKLEAIGTLAGGVAHDFNNVLTAITALAGDLVTTAEPGGNVHQAARQIERAASQGSQLTRQLVSFARQGGKRSEPVEVASLAADLADLVARTFTKSIRVERRLSSNGACVLGDPVQLQQVLLNLAMNARDAMPDGGSLTLASEVRALSGPAPLALVGLAAGRYVVLSVCDTGTGIAPEVLPRIFEPFFTTKTGMGLAVVYGIVKEHAGAVEVESEPGRGTSFRVWLPALDEVAPPARAPALAPEPVPARAADVVRVLVVDDEDEVRAIALRVLGQLGFETDSARDGVEALERYRARRADVVLLDLAMPRMSGRECFASLKALDPEVRVVLVTGAADASVKALLTAGACRFLPKPWAVPELARTVEDVAGRRAGR